MTYRKKIIGVIILPLVLCTSCLHSKTTSPTLTIRAGIKISSGNATVRIDGRVNENLHPWSIFNDSRDEMFNDHPVIREGSITKNETRAMVTGEEYRFSILPTEVVVLNIKSSDDNDVEVIVYRQSREEKHTIKGSNRLGLSVALQNR